MTSSFGSNDSEDVAQEALSYFYYIFFTVCLVAALFVLSQATVVTTFGPSMALKGNTSDAVKVASSLMHKQQLQIYKVAALSISSLFLGSCLACWSFYPIGVSVITTIVYMVAYYFVVREALNVINTFASAENDTFIDSGGMGSGVGDGANGGGGGGGGAGSEGGSGAGYRLVSGDSGAGGSKTDKGQAPIDALEVCMLAF